MGQSAHREAIHLQAVECVVPVVPGLVERLRGRLGESHRGRGSAACEGDEVRRVVVGEAVFVELILVE